MQAQLYFDGSSLDKGRRGGPSHSSGAAVLMLEDGVSFRDSLYLAQSDSCSAEFLGLICGLRLALRHGLRRVAIHGDSRIVIDAISGRKIPKKVELNLYREECLALLEKFEDYSLQWIPRRRNLLADQEARLCLNSHRAP